MELEKDTIVSPKNVHHGHNIQRIRRVKGLTQKQLGDLVHMCQQQVSYYEKEEVIEDIIIKKFAESLGVSEDFIKEMEEETPLTVYIENNTISDISDNKGNVVGIVGGENTNNTTNQNDQALYTALEQMQKLYEKGMELYESSLQSNNNLLKALQERIDILEKQQNK
ncbi:helix-turn-helix domain-containing protein [Parabacteroides pacaensis]|uniref:helix-turn-helix domain-containing protein n=1 Tax=Parabacteroides pacaensis TaxID=2086575 RepID=UPI000D0FC99C|nr:helix-turn-helix transcriptional regulator [Parabacteroides pacaensis]